MTNWTSPTSLASSGTRRSAGHASSSTRPLLARSPKSPAARSQRRRTRTRHRWVTATAFQSLVPSPCQLALGFPSPMMTTYILNTFTLNQSTFSLLSSTLPLPFPLPNILHRLPRPFLFFVLSRLFSSTEGVCSLYHAILPIRVRHARNMI